MGKYLGFPILHRKPNKEHCHFIIEKLSSKLAGWKAKFLTMAGRTTLINALVIPTVAYYMQAMYLPTSIHNRINKLCCDFLWGSIDEKKKLHLISWEQVTETKKNRGIGLKEAKALNKAYFAKLAWQIISRDSSPWVEVFIHKYILNRRGSSNSSPIWKAISSCSNIVNQGLRWIIKSGDKASLFLEDWTSLGPLKHFCVGPLTLQQSKAVVRDIIDDNGDWNFQGLHWVLPQEVISTITAIPVQRFNNSSDCLSWRGSTKGKFSISEAYNLARTSNNQGDERWNWIWKTNTLPRIQFFLRMLCHNRIASKDLLFHRKITNENSCPFYGQQVEDVDHIF